MSDPVSNDIRFPIMPDKFADDPDIQKYFEELERIIRSLLCGAVRVSGDLHSGGRIYARDAGGDVVKLFEDGVLGN